MLRTGMQGVTGAMPGQPVPVRRTLPPRLPIDETTLTTVSFKDRAGWPPSGPRSKGWPGTRKAAPLRASLREPRRCANPFRAKGSIEFTAGTESEFVVQAKDAYGNALDEEASYDGELALAVAAGVGVFLGLP